MTSFYNILDYKKSKKAKAAAANGRSTTVPVYGAGQPIRATPASASVSSLTVLNYIVYIFLNKYCVPAAWPHTCMHICKVFADVEIINK